MKRRLRLYPFLLIAGVLLLWPGVRARAITEPNATREASPRQS